MTRSEHVVLPTVSCRTTCFSAVVLLVEVACTPVFFVMGHASRVYSNTLNICGVLSLLSVLCGVLGMTRATPALVASLMVSISTSFLFVLLGGLSILFSYHLDLPLAGYLDQSLVPVTADEKTKLVRDTKRFLSVAAALLLSSSALHAVFGHHLYYVVGERRGATAFLQIFSILTLPFSVFLLVGGQYVVDTGTLASAPYTGIVIFAVGVATLVIAMLAFVGGNFEYRRLLSICCLLSFVVGAGIVGVSIAYFAMRKGIHKNLVEHWEVIRDILPPTYQARYDREQFGAFMDTNLKMVAYVGIMSGLFLMSVAGVCLTLMHQSTLFKRQLAQDKEVMKLAQGEGANSAVDPGETQVHRRRQWTAHFEISKRRQRIAMRVAALVFVVGVAFIFSVLCANVVFVSKCSSISKLMQSFSVALAENADEASASAINITNRFARGALFVAPASNGSAAQMLLDVYGNKGGGRKTSDFYAKSFANSTTNFTVQPLEVTRFLWIDGTCQRSVMTLSLPRDPIQALTISANTSVDINLLVGRESLPVRGVIASTTQSNIRCAFASILEDGLSLRSVSGQITARDFTVNGKGSVAVDTKAVVYSELGQVEVQNVSLNERGDVYARGVVTEGNSAFMGRFEVTTIAGGISLEQVDASGGVHVESSSGGIRVQLSTLTFVGMYFMRSERGAVSIRKGEYSGDDLVELSDASDGQEKHGAINCNAEDGSCLSFGELHLRSQYGDIEIVLGCDTFQCN
ncbi:hypothetical protein PybrP1_005478 [[Pythium] brassicae (nom. inval.)]|nr:hypothetical protein PybrP1_005478 [[Pythium] brassicae (nom. inval.)]